MENNKAFLFLQFDGSKLIKIYHSSKFLKDQHGYAVLDTPMACLFARLLVYHPYLDVHFSIYTNNTEKSLKIFTDYSEFVEEKIGKSPNYTFTPYYNEYPDIILSLSDFNKQFRDS